MNFLRALLLLLIPASIHAVTPIGACGYVQGTFTIGTGVKSFYSGSSQLNDQSGNGNNLTRVGTVPQTSGGVTDSPPFGTPNWLATNNTNGNYLSAPSALIDEDNGSIEVYYTIYPGDSGLHEFADIRNSGNNANGDFQLDARAGDDTYYVSCGRYNGTSTFISLASGTMTEDGTQHVARYEWGSFGVRLYIDCSQVDSTATLTTSMGDLGFDSIAIAGRSFGDNALGSKMAIDAVVFGSTSATAYPVDFNVDPPTPTQTFTESQTFTETQTFTEVDTPSETPTFTPTPTPFAGVPPYLEVGVQNNCFANNDNPVPYIYYIDNTNGTTLGKLTLTSGDLSLCGITGMDRNPADGRLYAIVSVTDSTNRYVVSIDETTGATTTICTLTGGTVQLAFTDTGKAFTTLKVPSNSIVLMQINLSTGAMTNRGVLGFWCESSLSFSKVDGLLYFFDTCDSSNYKTIDPTTYVKNTYSNSSGVGPRNGLTQGEYGYFYGHDGFNFYHLAIDFSSYNPFGSFDFPDGGRSMKGAVFAPAWTPSITPTDSPTPAVPDTDTPTPTDSPTPTETPTETATPTESPTPTYTPTISPTRTITPTATNTPTATPTASPTRSPTPCLTPGCEAPVSGTLPLLGVGR